jgi:hypothetical protein
VLYDHPTMHHTAAASLIAAAGLMQAGQPAPSQPPVTFSHVGTHATGTFDRSASEIAAYHPASKRLWVVNGDIGLDVLDISDPASPRKVTEHRMDPPTSVAIHGDVVAVAVPAKGIAPGTVRFLSAIDGKELAAVTVGHGPDMCTFTPDGTMLLVANEGEPSESEDPEGSISIIDLKEGPSRATVRTVAFGGLEPHRARLVGEGAHLPVPGRSVAQQFEPEYVAITPDGKTAIVAIQEANAILAVDLASAEITRVHGLGLKDFGECGMDPSDKDGTSIRPVPVRGLRQPDTVVCWEQGGTLWIATSNEGEVRETGGIDEKKRVSALSLDPKAFPDASTLQRPDQLGRLQVSAPACDADGDGLAERLVGFGGRGITIWTLDDAGLHVKWDSGSEVERAVAARGGMHNRDAREAGSEDARSTSKGPEPEGLALATVDGRRLLVVGLERPGGCIAWDVTDPTKPAMIADFHRFRPDAKPSDPAAGDIAPEGLLVIPADRSPDGSTLLVVCNEVSGTTSIWRIAPRAQDPRK